MNNPNIQVNVNGPQALSDALRSYGTIVLKPNIQDNRNVLTQDMLSKRNTKYVIQWNYDLLGETITVPDGCIIEFNGGTISNGTIVGSNTILLYDKNIDEICTANREGTFIYNTTVADEEDITSVSGQLKFKDRPATDGMGRKILRKNIVNGVNTLTQSMMQATNTIYVIQYDFTLGENITIPANCVLELDGGSIDKNEHTIDYAAGYDSCIICPTAEKLIASSCFVEGQFVRTLGYYNPNDGGGGLFKIEDTIPSDYILYYTLANGRYAVCMDNDIVLPRYGGVYVNQMVDNARQFMTPNNRKVIILPSPNGNHPGCMSYNYPGVTKPEIYYWLVNAPIVIDKYFGDSDCYFSGGISVAPGVEHIEAVMKVSDGTDKPENIFFPTSVQLNGRIISEQSKIVADHALLVEGVARLHFANLQAGYAKNSVTLGGTNNNNTIEFQAELMEIGAHTEKALNITGNLSKIVDIYTLRIQYAIGDNNQIGVYLNGDMTSSHINKLLISAGGAYTAFDMTYTGTGAGTYMPVLSCLEASVSAYNFGSFTNGTYSMDVVRASLTGDDVERSITLGNNTRFHCLDFRVINNATLTHSAFKINTSASAGFFANTVYPSPEKNGRNIFINGVTTSGISVNLFPEGLLVDAARNNSLCIISGEQKIGEICTKGDFLSIAVAASGTRTIDNIHNGSLFVYKIGGFYALCVIDETSQNGVTKLGGSDGGIDRCTPSWSDNTLTLTNTTSNNYAVELIFIVKI